MKKIYIAIAVVSAVILGMAGKSTKSVFSPDRIFVVGDELVVANRAAKQLVKLSADGTSIEKRLNLKSAATDLVQLPDGDVWVVCDGNMGWMYRVDGERFAVQRRVESGASPSAVEYSAKSGSLWVAQRYGGELWEVDITTGEKLSAVKVGREPVDVVTFDDDALLLVANNLPEMAATEEHVAAQLDVVDVEQRKVVSRILLPNGATDVKAVAKDTKGEWAYVTHLLARYQLPTTQLDRGWMSTNAMSIIDLKTQQWLTTVLLDTPQKGAANLWGISVTPDNREIVVAAAGSQEVVVIDREALHARLERARAGEQVTPSMNDWDNIPNDAGFLYGIRQFIPTSGKGVRSVAATGDKIYATNYYTAEVVTISRKDFSKQLSSLGTSLAATVVGRGDMYFHDATLCYQTWQSCATCHPNDGRVDGLNWDLLNDGMGNPKNSKSLLLSHQTAPCMATGIRANAETAVRAGVKYILFAANVDDDVCVAMDEYLKAQKPVASPYLVGGKLSESAKRGKEIFARECAACHSGNYYSDFKQYNVGWTSGADKGRAMDVPHLNECWRTAPYLYDGRSATIHDMLKIHGPHSATSPEQLNDLAEYVLSL